jgi:hypothetical protein
MIINCYSSIERAKDFTMLIFGLFAMNAKGDDDLYVAVGNAATV